MTHPDAPVGGDATRTRSSRSSAKPQTFDFKPKDHVALCEALDLARLRSGHEGRGAEVLLPQERGRAARTGARAVRDADAGEGGLHAGHHARPGARRGARRHRLHAARPEPGDAADLHRRGHRPVPDRDRGDHARRHAPRPESSTRRELPKRYVGLSHCFRTEAGAAGPRHARAVPRPPVHQGRDVRVLHAGAERRDPRRRSARIEEEIFQGLGLAVPRHRHLHRRPRRAGVPQVRPRSVDARPRRQAASTAR